MAINNMTESTDDLRTKESITSLGAGIFDEKPDVSFIRSGDPRNPPHE